MYCPRLDHFVRLNTDGTVSRCGHMIAPPRFASVADMDASIWLGIVKAYMQDGDWPDVCYRCRDTESVNSTSVRLNAIRFHEKQTRPDYLSVGGVLDNVCNSACLTCNENHSTKIGSLANRIYLRVDNSAAFGLCLWTVWST